jgi:RNA polymerase sigma-70 factor (ECF subfamily)
MAGCAEAWDLPGRRWRARRGTMIRSEPDQRGGSAMRLADLVQAVAARQDRAAFVTLFGFYAPRVKTMLMRAGTEASLAEEIAQETLLTVWRKAATYDPARAGVAAWIFTIARNLRIDRLRRDKRAALHAVYETIEQEVPPQPDEVLGAAEREARVRAALARLPGAQIRVIELSFFENRAHSDIAATLGIPLGTVKSRLRLAMTRLREFLGDMS